MIFLNSSEGCGGFKVTLTSEAMIAVSPLLLLEDTFVMQSAILLYAPYGVVVDGGWFVLKVARFDVDEKKAVSDSEIFGE